MPKKRQNQCASRGDGEYSNNERNGRKSSTLESHLDIESLPKKARIYRLRLQYCEELGHFWSRKTIA